MEDMDDMEARYEVFFQLAERFDEYEAVRAARYKAPAPGGTPSVPGNRPGDDFNRRASWAEILEPHGWVSMGGSAEVTKWRRPGKTGYSWSATTGYCQSNLRLDLLYVFTTSAPPFESEEAYSKFEAYALLEHDGQWAEAARALQDKGYGPPPGGDITVHYTRPENGKTTAQTDSVAISPPIGGERETQPPEPTAPGWPLPIPASQLRRADANAKWVWHGCLSRAGVTLLSALWKSGKTTLLAHLLKAMEGEGTFCGLAVKPCRVLFVSEEDETTWAERRDELQLRDHLEFIPRPFRARPTLPDWKGFLAHLAALVTERRFDVVVFDTISKMWPVRDENDAPAVENALLPLYALTDRDAAVLIVHHLRKGDGQEATASRGSGSLPAFVETILELRRYEAANRKDTRRVLTGYGRYRETPTEVVLDLGPRGFLVLGEKHEVAQQTALARLLAVLPVTEPGLTTQQLMDACGMAKKTMLPLLEDLCGRGEVRRSGQGTKGSAYLYWCPSHPAVPVPSPIGEERGTAGSGPTPHPAPSPRAVPRSLPIGEELETPVPGPSPAEAPSLSPAPHDLLFAALKGEVLLALSVAVTATVEHLVACLGHSAAELEPVLASLVAEGRVVTWEELVLAEGSTDAPTTLYGLPAQEDPPDTP